MKTIWISRDSSRDRLDVWSDLPWFDEVGVWCGGDGPREFVMSCDDGREFIKKLLGDSWPEEGTFCVEIQIASIETVVSDRQKLVEQLRTMTKSSFRKATIIEAAKLLDGK